MKVEVIGRNFYDRVCKNLLSLFILLFVSMLVRGSFVCFFDHRGGVFSR